VAEVLENESEHLTANEIWERVQQLDESIGRMTVYRTLELFTEIGYIRPAPQAANDARNGLVYVVMRDGHHHHIICQRCSSVIEFEDCGLEELIGRIEKKYDCQIEGHLLEFFGTCADCLD
jgi:Fur family ferric uptake transcriptional regulator